MRRSLGSFVVLLGLPAGLLVLFGFLGPTYVLADSASHFRLHLSAALLLAAVVLVALRWWVPAVVFAAFALAGGLSTAALTGLLTAATALPNGDTLRLFSFNMRYTNTEHAAVLVAIRDADPDIIILQETSRRNAPVLVALEEHYQRATDCHQAVGDLAILVRPPLRATGASGCQPLRGIAWSQVAVGARTMTLMAVHLHWPAPFRQPRDLDALERVFPDVPRPIMAAGDFNAAPWSHAVARVAAATGTAVAPGIRPSWIWRMLPARLASRFGLPLDHVLLPEGAAARSVRVLAPAGSDHLPVVADIVLP